MTFEEHRSIFHFYVYYLQNKRKWGNCFQAQKMYLPNRFFMVITKV